MLANKNYTYLGKYEEEKKAYDSNQPPVSFRKGTAAADKTYAKPPMKAARVEPNENMDIEA